MSDTYLISILGPDRVGLVAAVTGRLFDLGANLNDTTFAVLGTGAEFTSVCDFSHEIDPVEIRAELAGIPELAEAEVSVTPFGLDSEHGPSGTITHRIKLSGGDRPGLIARLCETFVTYDANIVRLNAQKTSTQSGDIYELRIAAWIPEKRADACLATIRNTAGELRLSCEWREV